MSTTRHKASSAAIDLKGKVGERGRYLDAMRKGHEVRVTREDGVVEVRHYEVAEGAVLLDPNVRRYFPDAEAVNAALRSLIDLIPKPPRKKSTKRKE